MLTQWLRRRAIRKLDEHLFLLRDQVKSGVASIRVYRARRKILEAKLIAAERPTKLIDEAIA